MSKFDKDTITDQKRLARGEHWLAVRTMLRRRDRIHNGRWRVLTLAGGHPAEEIACIKSLMPRAEIIAVDIDPKCCEAAIEAGADDVICCDLFDFPDKTTTSGSRGGRSGPLPTPIAALGDRFDAVNLDFCGTVTPVMEIAVYRYGHLVRVRGALMLTFAYGRDVVEALDMKTYRGIPAVVGSRVARLDSARSGSVQGSHALVSVLAYKGAAMPMCAALWLPSKFCGVDIHSDPGFVKIDDDDLVAAVAEPDIDWAALYALPAERILAMKRRWTALKAVSNRGQMRLVRDDESESGR